MLIILFNDNNIIKIQYKSILIYYYYKKKIFKGNKNIRMKFIN